MYNICISTKIRIGIKSTNRPVVKKIIKRPLCHLNLKKNVENMFKKLRKTQAVIGCLKKNNVMFS